MNTKSIPSEIAQAVESHPELIAIVGATASGKSDLAIAAAKYAATRGKKAAILNADSFSLYRGMEVGTAKVPLEERIELERETEVKHYLIDVLEPADTSNAATFQQLALPLIEQLHEDSVIPILVGGSGLYIRAVTDNFEFQQVDLNLRAELEHRAETASGREKLWEGLRLKDPATAATLQPENTRRIIRALEVIALSGDTYQRELPPYTNRFLNTFHFGIDISREELDRRIDLRTAKMRKLGLIDEVRRLQSELGVTAKKAIGYSETLSYLNGEEDPATGKPFTEDGLFQSIAQHTKRLVRRQESWFKRDPRIAWVKLML